MDWQACGVTSTALAFLLDGWRRTGRPIRAGRTAEAIAAVEGRLGVLLPDDLRTLYQVADGWDGAQDGDALAIRRLDDLAPCPPAEAPPLGLWSRPGLGDWFVLAEQPARGRRYLIWLERHRPTSNPVVLQDGRYLQRVAGSFTRFVVRQLGLERAGAREVGA